MKEFIQIMTFLTPIIGGILIGGMILPAIAIVFVESNKRISQDKKILS